MKKTIIIILIAILLLLAGTVYFYLKSTAINDNSIDSFEDCVAYTGNAIETLPRQCEHNGIIYSEDGTSRRR